MKKPSFATICLVSFSLAQLISLFGDRLNQFSVVGMVGKVEPGSSFELLVLSLFTHGPVLLFAPLFGSLIDRFHKGAVMVIADLFRGGIVFLLPALFLHFNSLYAFYVPVALLSLANLMFSPAKSAIIPEMVPESRLVIVNAILWGIGIAGTILGFLLGGWIFDHHSWQLSFYTDGASYIFSVLLLLPLLFLPRPRSRGPAPLIVGTRVTWKTPQALVINLFVSIREGIVLIRKSNIVGVSLLTQTALFGLGGLLYVICIAHIQEISPPDKTVFLSTAAVAGTVGLLIGALIAGAYRGALTSHYIVSIATILIGVSLIGIAKSHSLLTLSIWTAMLGTASSPVIIFTETLLQQHIPENFRGRIFATREVLTKTSFLALAMLATLVNAVVSKVVILVSVGLFLALLGMLLERKKFLQV